ncbi:PDDEXK family nuclease [Rhodococcus qingshengii]|uniref:hypothetical protein n=1 Tax=Rhodococcus qingshengii TaxID=334542 RepID=UPI002943EE42|nr:hypothetical protein [Rhodococcus qingshengii]WOI85950.1 hypothetical protein R0122_22485 [Rhodococcus qingshengii]
MRRIAAFNSEHQLQEQVCQYIRTRYGSDIVFMSDMSAGMKLTMGQAMKRKRINSSRSLPDLVVLHPVGEFHGLCLELKKEGITVFKKDGTIRSDEHLQEQHEMLKRLDRLGYYAAFASGYDQAIETIDDYFARNL